MFNICFSMRETVLVLVVSLVFDIYYLMLHSKTKHITYSTTFFYIYIARSQTMKLKMYRIDICVCI